LISSVDGDATALSAATCVEDRLDAPFDSLSECDAGFAAGAADVTGAS
jgi:hypothetical protein